MKITLTKNMAGLFSLLNQAINHINNDPSYGTGNAYHIASVDRCVVWVTDGKRKNHVGSHISYRAIECAQDYKDLADYLFVEIDN